MASATTDGNSTLPCKGCCWGETKGPNKLAAVRSARVNSEPVRYGLPSASNASNQANSPSKMERDCCPWLSELGHILRTFSEHQIPITINTDGTYFLNTQLAA